MKILLIIPRYNLTNKPNYQYAFPLGLGYISSVIKQAGYDVDCLNLNHLNGTIEELVKKTLDKKKYDLVGSGHIGIGYAVIEKIINAVKNHQSKPKFILGGILITSEPEIMFNSLNPDFGILGEGELTIIELIKCLENKGDLKKVEGICFKDENGKLIFTKPRTPIMDLDSLPFPDLDSMDFKNFLNNQSSDVNFNELDYPKSYYILCSRGCPYQCTFCYHSTGPKYRLRSLDNIFEEIREAVKKYNINSLAILDDLFSIDRERLLEFCRRIKELDKEIGYEINWSSQMNVNSVDKKMLETLKDSGCHVISFGFESYSREVLNSMKKPITPEQIDRAVKLSFEVGIGLQGAFIFGDTAETKETAKQTLDYWKNNCKGQIRLGFIQPYPGSEIYGYCIKKGIIKDKLDFIKNKIAHTNWFNMTEKMSNEEILQLKKDIIEARKYYPYSIPLNIKKEKDKKYSVKVKCPFCKEIIEYKNCYFDNILRYNLLSVCKKCYMRFFTVSKIYKLEMDYYGELDFFRKTYLSLKDRLLKRNL